ncbi:NAD(P)/FAD-dependent oxidoreductase [Streptacidiphilus jiangxiensis]|uniref:Phytoene dehydrogenase-related protein n=1 Tax=Streptacidiphilus jiangxiensis TaxID=235985 RepID=A0A1H7ZBK9_STRJI|nr:NAD(P)/FAD-dependent oxidoreductase [Streptacidiphilus jiangxiensis]SEM55655.1 Phytoene dehydrogenase-related protein [Streptacidiphilus jiangxiensis]
MTRTARVDAVVVGAGPAGLACATDLCDAGLEVVLLESAGRVGGRMVSDYQDGFVLDRGFQVFNTAYPQVRRRVDLRALRLKAFEAGFVLARGARGERRDRVADPTREPGALPGMLRLGPPRDLLALAALGTWDMLAPVGLVKRRRGTTVRQALQGAGLDDAFCEAVLAPFLRGVFLDQDLAVSGRFFHLVLRSMLRGSLCLPERGVAQIPLQLAERLPVGVLRLGSGVERLDGDGVRLAEGGQVRAPAVVVATGPAAARALLPQLPPVSARAVTTLYHAAPEAPWPSRQLLVDGDGQLLHTSVVSNVQPGYAPPGVALVSTSLLGTASPEQVQAAERRLAELYRTSTRTWERIAVHRISEALPALPAAQPLSLRTRLGPGRYVCGDHRATASVQGALASGAHAAREVLHDLAARQPRPEALRELRNASGATR